MKSFERNLQLAVAGNCYPAMAEVLAKELGVSAGALRSLGLGYLPHVEFKKGHNYDGHWTFPERDSVGRITGLSLRNRLEGRRKPMFPGSKHGLFFVPLTRDSVGADDRRDGPRWVRVADAGVRCPVCGKPDWCLVDATSPDDPAAAICPRTPSDRDFGDAGYLHIFDEERAGRLTGAASSTNPLAPSRFPVFVVEGATDTAALVSLGLVAVGRPSATGGFTTLASLLRARPDVVVVGENDEKTDGSWPGKFGAEKTLKALESVCPRLRVVFPPADFKDVRQWIHMSGVSTEAFLEHVDKYAGLTVTDRPVEDSLPDANVATTARALLERVYTADDKPTILRCQESWYVYGAGGWREEASRESVRGEVHRFLGRTKYRQVDHRSKTISVHPFDPTSRLVKNVSDHLSAIVPNPTLPPVWLDGRTSPLPERLLCFANGTLDVEDFIHGNFEVTPYMSDLFVTSRLPFEHDPTATCPRWNRWLQETLGDDRLKIDLLQEWFGYNLVPDTQYEKMLMMHGPTRSGKSTALGVLMDLLGPAAVSTNLKSFASDFGLHSLIGKLAATMPDAQTPDRGQASALQTLLEVIGNDHVEVGRKYKDSISTHLKARVTIACNQLPRLPDESLALAERMLPLTFIRSFSGHEEVGLKQRLKEELPGIMLWALEGLKRLHTNGRFTQPKDAQTVREDFRALVNPAADFIDTWVFASSESELPIDDIYEAWRTHAEERFIHYRNRQWLFDQLKVRFPSITRHTEVIDGKTVKIVTGVDLHDFAPNAGKH